MLSYASLRDKIAEDIEAGGWFYRGHADISWDLSSSYARFCSREGLEFSIPRFLVMLEQFIDIVSDLTGSDCRMMGYSEKIAFAQHHGLPTPFLDWSSSPYIALYFAVCDRIFKFSAGGEGPVRIWALRLKSEKLNTSDLNLQNSQVEFALIKSKIFYSRRVYRQAGCFSYLGFQEDLYEQRNKFEIDIKWYDVSGDLCAILLELNAMGIGAANLFDDADGVAKEVVLKTVASQYSQARRRAT